MERSEKSLDVTFEFPYFYCEKKLLRLGSGGRVGAADLYPKDVIFAAEQCKYIFLIKFCFFTKLIMNILIKFPSSLILTKQDIH